MSFRTLLFVFAWCSLAGAVASAAEPAWLTFTGTAGAGRGKSVVLIAGDEEYRSEETMPMLAKILSQRHGFTCTVLFPIDPASGVINPNLQTNIPGLEALAKADLLIINTRFRQLPPAQLRWLADYLKAGKPVIGLRTATHAFTGDTVTDGIVWKNFGLEILGEKWVSHHGEHKVQGTRSIVEPSQSGHAILRGVGGIFGPSDVYTVANLPADATILLRGLVTASLAPDSKPIAGAKNTPPMPIAWVRAYQVPAGRSGQAFCTTLGASVDFLGADLRRLIVNAAFALTELPVPEAASVALVDPFAPTFYGFIRDERTWLDRGLKPSDFALGKATTPFAAVPVPKAWADASTTTP